MIQNKVVLKSNNVLLYVIVILTFLCGIFSPEIILSIQAVLLILAFKKLKISKIYFVTLIVLIIHGLIGVVLGTDTLILVVKEIFGIGVSCLFYYTYINRNNILEIIAIYKKCTCVVAVIAIIQQIAYRLGISVIYSLKWLVPSQLNTASANFYRSSSIFTEPSQCALVMMPMVFIALYSMSGKYRVKTKRLIDLKEAICILCGYIVTFSSSGYIGLFIIMIIIWSEYKYSFKQVSIFVAMIILFFVLYFNVTVFQERLNDTWLLFSDYSTNVPANISSQTIVLNFRIALKSFANSFGFGGGIGSHPISYNKYIGLFDVGNLRYLFNQEDANSLALRIISELGVIGIFGSVFYVIKYRNKEKNSIINTINKMCLACFALRLLRYGHYFDNGFWMFVILYYVCSKEKRKEKQFRENINSNYCI